MSEQHTILLFAQNKRGVLERITMIIRRKMYNLEQITASDTQDEGIKRLTITFSHKEGEKIPQIMAQLNKIVEVIKVQNVSSKNSVKREVVLIKIKRPKELSQVVSICEIFKAEIVEINKDNLIIQGVGESKNILKLRESLSEFGILGFGSSGSVAMEI